ncbi:exodeoxyribonuclease VII small subunit [Pediococcus pentosaceus]|jgi:exodeoxyribonuclease VII small subunit|uniref:Exodeoxyribonuclease 7 small subunit n=3 Tax=Pediococcus pentosaceus TaxID=1255 RepID=EX7S_PEDPA|nr:MULTISPECIES: exodeoxyribonuclease VII small subunit [Pediococcus]Q03FZ3.1 RecName: Full=Exodeoxyribonuclease 7 small subunit; AltName: Full=Exodeoxyribonuclease VII small subunit; Short=Exonuclease VII small subunit [Pediococcus pentosaceus ATCC 25745]ABJ67879.1 Exodeoxyribonuclease VII small subunit [Pediococcus pentosaceus ATCC 25745]AHA04946.1 exodeoxyribonuclease VII small subunit [Pediococcus pentosaceus SL4]ANI98024.1 exodeoxyribonuclease VII small subunit [Pediococcus pentosaceus]AR
MAEEKTFEENLQELQQVVSNLEQGDIPLEKALTEFQKGIQLSSELQETLKNAEKTLTKVMQDNGEETNLDLGTDGENE